MRLLLAIAFVAALIGLWRRTVTIFQIGLVGALIVLVPVYADVGTVSNHLIDSAALAIVVTGGLFAATSPASLRGRLLSVGLVVCVLTARLCHVPRKPPGSRYPRSGARAYGAGADADAPYAARGIRPTWRRDPFGRSEGTCGSRPTSGRARSVHPSTARRDPSRLAARPHPAAARARLAELFLEHRPEQMERSTDVRFWYSTLFFGRPIVTAIARDYRAVGKVERLWVYRPRVLPQGAALRRASRRGGRMRIRGKQADCGAATGARVMPRGPRLWSSGTPLQTLTRHVDDDISLPGRTPTRCESRTAWCSVTEASADERPWELMKRAPRLLVGSRIRARALGEQRSRITFCEWKFSGQVCSRRARPVTLERKAWWFDEAHDVTLARLHWLRLIGEAGYYEPSQALYLVLFEFWRTFTPESEWFTRFPSVAAAVAAAALTVSSEPGCSTGPPASLLAFSWPRTPPSSRGPSRRERTRLQR